MIRPVIACPGLLFSELSEELNLTGSMIPLGDCILSKQSSRERHDNRQQDDFH